MSIISDEEWNKHIQSIAHIHGLPDSTPIEDTPTILGSSQDEATPTAQGHEADNSLLEAFAEYCHEHYMGCGKREGEELWEYCYSDEIINLVPQFLGKRAEVADQNTPELVAARKQGYEAGLRQGHTDCEHQGERNDMIATGSSQDTVTPSRPGEHKKQELERGGVYG